MAAMTLFRLVKVENKIMHKDMNSSSSGAVSIQTNGVLYAVGAYIIWGLFPLYWKWLRHVSSLQLFCHRLFWSFVVFILTILLLRQWKGFYAAIKQPKVLLVYFIAATLISVNWLVFIWAVNAGFIIEASFGYFMSPLVNVLLGVVFLREKLRSGQWFAVWLASVAVIYLTFFYGSMPWIGLVLAFTLGGYGLIKKIAQLGSLYGLTLETSIMFLPVLIYLVYVEIVGTGALFHVNFITDILLVGTGIITAIPLLMFSYAARCINLSLVGFLQYIVPTLQFVVGKFIYEEPLTKIQFVGFSMVWLALAIFTIEGAIRIYRSRRASCRVSEIMLS